MLVGLDHFQRSPRVEVCQLILNLNACLFFLGTAASQGQCSVGICQANLISPFLYPSHPHVADMGGLGQKYAAGNSSRDILLRVYSA
jgi:hypothetical protein